MAYGLKYWAEVRNYREHDTRVEIWQKNYSGTSKEIGEVCGLVLDFRDASGGIDGAIVKTEVRLSIVDSDDMPDTATVKHGNWQEFYTPDATKYMVKLYRYDGSSWSTMWSGYITPDSWSESLDYRGTVTITARDNIGHLSDFDFDMAGDADGLVSVRDMIDAAMDLIEMPMTVAYQDQDMYDVHVVQAEQGYGLFEALFNVSLFEGRKWYDAIETVLADLGLTLRYTDDNTITITSLRNLPLLGHLREQSVLEQNLEFYGGSRRLDPAVKQINDKIDYDYKDDVEMDVLGVAAFGSDSTYPCRIIVEVFPGSSSQTATDDSTGTLNPVSDKGSSIFGVGSALLDTSKYDISSMTRRAEGDGAKDYAFLATNDSSNPNTVTQSFEIPVISPNITVKFQFAQRGARIENGRIDVAYFGGYLRLYQIKYFVKYVVGSSEYYWNGGRWVSENVTLTRDFEEGENDFELAFINGSVPDNGTIEIYFDGITMRGVGGAVTAFGAGCYARLKSVSISVNADHLESDTTKTINNEDYNVILSRDTSLGALSRAVAIAAARNYPGALFFDYGGVLNPFPYDVYWDQDYRTTLLPLPVQIHKQILCYHHSTMEILEGSAGIVGKYQFYFNRINIYKGHRFLLLSGSLNFLEGVVDSAIFREFIPYDELWGDTITVTPSSVSLSASAQTSTLRITAPSDTAWSITGVPAWLTLSATSGTGSGTITVSAAKNSSTESRSASLSIGGTVVTITQAAGEAPVVTPARFYSNADRSITNVAQTVQLQVVDSGNAGWYIQATSGYPFSPTGPQTGSGTVTVTIPANTGNLRHIVVRLFSGGAQTDGVDIIQAAGSATADPTISPTTAIAAGAAGTTVQLTITDADNVGWRLTCSNSEVTFSQSSGTGSATVTATLPANSTGASRHLVVYLRPSSGSTSYGYCDITQAAAVVSEWSVRLEYPTVDEAAGTFAIYVKAPANEQWELSDSLGILTFWPASGTGTGEEVEYMFDIPAYPATSYKSRATTIYLGDGQALRDQVTLTQAHSWRIDFAGPLPASAGSGAIEITAPEGEPWSIVVDDSSWLHVSALSGTGPATIPFTVDANTTGNERETEVYLYDGNGQLAGNQNITVIQLEGTVNPSMTASKTTGISAAGETITLQISNPSSVAWTLRALYADGDVTFSQSSGSSGATVTATIPANTTGNQLSIEIRLRVNGSSVQTITLTQNA